LPPGSDPVRNLAAPRAPTVYPHPGRVTGRRHATPAEAVRLRYNRFVILFTLVAALALPLAGKTVAVDPGHNGGNFAHPRAIGGLVDAATLRKPCDTTGTATANGYTEAEYTF